MRRFLYENSLSLVMLGLFLATLAIQSVVGLNTENEDRKDHEQDALSYAQYLSSGNFVESVFENWESEFLQMGTFVLLTVFLRQKGSPESKKLEGEEAVDEDPRSASRRKNVPWPVRARGMWLTLYENSLSIALFALFFMSFSLHAIGGAANYNEEQLEHGGETVSALGYLGTSQFWFESMQNWQSEFLSIGVLAVLAIFLRQKGSPESKPVAAPHDETGHG